MAMLLEEPVVQTYQDVELLLIEICNKFTRRYGAYDYDDMTTPVKDTKMFADAKTIYLETFNGYDVNKGANFTTYLHCKVWWGLMSIKRRIAQKIGQHKTEALNGTDLAAGTTQSDRIRELLTSVSRDAQQVISICMDPPQEIADVIGRAVNNPQTIRKAVVNFLYHTLGWDCDRIDNTWNEVAAAL